MSSEQVTRYFCALIGRLASHDWFTARISVCNLFVVALAKVAQPKQDDLLKIYIRLCGDDTPMVRRQAAIVLGSVAQVLQDEDMLSEILEIFQKLAKDDQDSVRILAITNCTELGKLKSNPEWQAQILPVVKACADDRSWRVRYSMADSIKQLCEGFKAQAQSVIIPLFLKQLADQEPEVRTIAAYRIA